MTTPRPHVLLVLTVNSTPKDGQPSRFMRALLAALHRTLGSTSGVPCSYSTLDAWVRAGRAVPAEGVLVLEASHVLSEDVHHLDAASRLHIILVAMDAPIPADGLVSLKHFLERHPADDWVFVDTPPFGATDLRTLLEIRPGRSHHLGFADAKGWDRLARIVLGRGIGVVLGGGGARTFAHIGALEAFENAGVPIDFLGGCSGGAMFAAQKALGWTIPQMREAAWHHFVERGRTLLPTVPLVSLISERPFVRILEAQFGDARIEDLPIPFFCVSTNLTRRKLVVHREGLVRAAVRASMSVPGVAPPHVEWGEVYVDGCVLDPLPVATMRAMGAGIVVGVDVGTPKGPAVSPHLKAMPSPWDLLRERLPWKKHRTQIVFWWDVLLASALAGAKRDETAADLVIRPNLEGTGLLDFRAMHYASALAYKEVMATFASLPPSLRTGLSLEPSGVATPTERRSVGVDFESVEPKGLH